MPTTWWTRLFGRSPQSTPRGGTTRMHIEAIKKSVRKNHSSASLPASSFEPGTRRFDLNRPRSNPLVWMLLGAVTAMVSQILGWFFFFRGWAWSGSILFTVCALGGFIFPIFQRNSTEIWDKRYRPREANARLALDLATLFVGIMLGFLLVALWAGPKYLEWFSGLDSLLSSTGHDLSDRRNGNFFFLSFHNLRVLAAFFLIGLLLRYLGLLFVIVYNGALWGVIFGLAMRGVLPGPEMHGFAALLVPLIALPHTLIEISADVVAAMAGVFTGRLLLLYSIGSPPFQRVGKAVLRLLIIAIVLLVFAAVIENQFARRCNHLLVKPDRPPSINLGTTVEDPNP